MYGVESGVEAALRKFEQARRQPEEVPAHWLLVLLFAHSQKKVLAADELRRALAQLREPVIAALGERVQELAGRLAEGKSAARGETDDEDVARWRREEAQRLAEEMYLDTLAELLAPEVYLAPQRGVPRLVWYLEAPQARLEALIRGAFLRCCQRPDRREIATDPHLLAAVWPEENVPNGLTAEEIPAPTEAPAGACPPAAQDAPPRRRPALAEEKRRLRRLIFRALRKARRNYVRIAYYFCGCVFQWEKKRPAAFFDAFFGRGQTKSNIYRCRQDILRAARLAGYTHRQLAEIDEYLKNSQERLPHTTAVKILAGRTISVRGAEIALGELYRRFVREGVGMKALKSFLNVRQASRVRLALSLMCDALAEGLAEEEGDD